MNQSLFNRIVLVVLAYSALLLCAGRTPATKISGNISSTLTIYDDSELVGDVTCAVSGAPCITFGAPSITLRLNGFAIRGPAHPLTPATGCTSTTVFAPEDGIQVLRDGVAILGPGRVRKFRRWGISLGDFKTGAGVKHVRVKRITFSENCFSGLQLIAVTDSEIEGNVSVRNAGGSNGFPCGGTWLISSHNNRVRLNRFDENGSVPRTNPPGPGFVSNNFGLGLIGTSSDNLIEENKIGGNFNGVYLGPDTKGGNIFRRNVIVGNPPVQISSEFGASVGADIQDHSNPTLGSNIFEDNRCLTYAGARPSPCPNVGKPQKE